MSDSDSDSDAYIPKRGFPLHEACEKGDLELLKRIVSIKDGTAAEGNGMNEDELHHSDNIGAIGQITEGMEVEEYADAAGNTEEGGKKKSKGEDEEDNEDDEDEDDGSYKGGEEGSGDDDDDDDDDEEDEFGGEGGFLMPVPIDLNEKDNFNCTALHVALHARQLEAVKILLEAGADVAKKTEGSSPLHTALAVGGIAAYQAFAVQATNLLIEHDTDVNAKDDALHNPLHLASFHGLHLCVRILIEKGATESLDTKDRLGNRPLHLAARQGHTNVLKELVAAEADLRVSNFRGQNALHLACLGGHWEAVAYLVQAGEGQGLQKHKDKQHRTAGQVALRAGLVIPANLQPALGIEEGQMSATEATNAKTLLVCDPSCSRHMTCTPIIRSTACDPPPENVNRLHVLINEETGILRGSEFASCEWLNEAPRAQLADLVRVHEYDYLKRIMTVCESLPPSPYAIGHLDGDTAVSRESWEAALRAAGAACEAVDRVLAGKNRNVFCAVRPPGHHAGSRGVVKCDPTDQGSHGFCLINNVAVAAAYARHVYRHRGIKKVVIYDFDVHHGNGTEEIVENIVPRVEEVTLGRDRLPWCDATFTATKYKPWLNEDDAKDVLFVSVHGYGGRNLMGQGAFYPGSGRTRFPDVVIEGEAAIARANGGGGGAIAGHTAKEGEGEEGGTEGGESVGPQPMILDVGMKLVDPTETVPGTNRVEWRTAMRDVVLPRVARFKPDLILISAGFDAHRKDSINMGYLGLVEEDYEWITRHLIRIANTFCHGRVVSVLEGGYRIQGGLVSAFARSVAAHVRALVDGCHSREGYDEGELQWESAHEQKQQELKLKKMDDRLREQADRFRQAMVARNARMEALDHRVEEGGEGGGHAAAVEGGVFVSTSSTGGGEGEVGGGGEEEAEVEVGAGGRRKRRAASGKVDYVALAKKMKEEEKKAAAGES